MIAGFGGLATNAGVISKILELLTKFPLAKTLLESLQTPKSTNELSSQLNLGKSDINDLLGKLMSVKAIEQTGDQYKITEVASQALKRVTLA